MTVKKDERMVKSKKNKEKLVKKITYKCEGSYVDINGVAHRYHKRGFSSSDEAKEWERKFLLKAKTEIDSDMTFDDLFHLYMNDKKNSIKKTSIYEIEKLYDRNIKPFFGDMKLNKINLSVISIYTKNLSEHKKSDGTFYSNRTLEKIQTRFKTILKYGYTMGYITDYRITIFKNVQRPEEMKKEMLFWQPNEFKKFIITVDNPIYLAFFNVLYWCGLRKGEALALQWKDINWKEKSIYIGKSYSKRLRQLSTPKTNNSYRTVIMTEECFVTLDNLYKLDQKYAGFNDDMLIFHLNKPLDDNCIVLFKDRCIKKAGVKRIRIHDFRHSHVSLLISLGFNPFDIAKRLGHTVEMVNNVYGHWFDDAQQKL